MKEIKQLSGPYVNPVLLRKKCHSMALYIKKICYHPQIPHFGVIGNFLVYTKSTIFIA